MEILAGDCFKLGAKAEPRLSGDLDGTPGITLVGPKGSVQTKEGLMVAQRHIHMHPDDAARFGVHDGQSVSIETDGVSCGYRGSQRDGNRLFRGCHSGKVNRLFIKSIAFKIKIKFRRISQ